MATERPILLALCAALAGAVFFAAPAAGTGPDATIEDFFGKYVGDARMESGDEFRDIIVAIEPARNGFSIYSSTVIREGRERAVPGVKWRAETQTFVASRIPGLYEPLLRESMFVRRRTPILVDGDTVAWASIRGRTLGIYAMVVLADGYYELRVYERTLTDLGLDLTFTRYRDGVAIVRLTGALARADN